MTSPRHVHRILVVEDDDNIRHGLAALLTANGYAVDEAGDGEAGLAAFARAKPDLVLLDVMMPGMNGYDVCRAIRKDDARTPVVMLTAKDDEIDKVLGLELGADDYIVKPFGVRELLARLAAVLRRAAPAAPSGATAEGVDSFAFGPDRVDAARYELVRADGSRVGLSARELALLKLFAAEAGKALTRDHLLNAVWGVSYFGSTRTLDQHVAQLRKKLTDARAIETLHGIGYRHPSVAQVYGSHSPSFASER